MKDIEDGIYPVYVKDGKAYPIALTQDQVDMLPLVVRVLGKLHVIIDKPIGEVVNLIEKRILD